MPFAIMQSPPLLWDCHVFDYLESLRHLRKLDRRGDRVCHLRWLTLCRVCAGDDLRGLEWLRDRATR